MILLVLLAAAGFLIAIFGALLSSEHEVLRMGFVMVGIVMIGVAALLFQPNEEVKMKRFVYEDEMIFKANKAEVAKLEMMKGSSSSSSEIDFIMILTDGTTEKVDSELYAKLDKGVSVYWDTCLENCKGFKNDDAERKYYIKK